MRIRHLLGAFAALFLSMAAGAVPAKPGPFQYTQPDGSVVTLERHGDEFLRWTTLYGTSQVVELDKDGFWRPSQISEARREAARVRRQAVGEQQEQRRRTRIRSNVSMTHGSRHIPVFLVEFPDKSFSIEAPADSFNAMLNQPGYSDNGGTGCVQDYFLDNSHEDFQPIFDVYGPVMLPHEMAYYGKDVNDWDQQPELALFDACIILADQIDFSIYDADGDGFVDMTLFYYAGYSQAEGAPKDAIWPHQYTVQGSASAEARNTQFNGKRLGDYFCTAELKGSKGTNQCGIGPTCHEFSHSLGLPDFYDTDYEKNGQCAGLTSFSLMDGGCYLNESRTPPYLNAEERVMLGWMAEEEVLELASGTVSFPSIQNNVAYMSYTNSEGEYFLYECRDGSGWDVYLPEGMLVYHADKSRDHRVGNSTAYDLWDRWQYSNAINAYGNHPCFYVVPAAEQSNLNYKGTLSKWVFPGSSNVKSYSPKDWNGDSCGVSINDISYADGKVSFSAKVNNTRTLRGRITNPGGKALFGVHVMVSKVNSSGASAQIPLRIARNAQEFSAYTDKDGCFEIALDGFDDTSCHITASLEDFAPYGTDVNLNKRGPTSVSITLSYVDQNDIQYYDERAQPFYFGDFKSNTLMASIRIPSDRLPAEGGEVTHVSFMPVWTASAYYIVVDSGEDRILTYRLPGISKNELNKMRTVDLSDVVNHFPPGKDLYVGYAVKDAQISNENCTGMPFIVAPGVFNIYLSEFSLESSTWIPQEEYDGYALVMKASIIPADKDKPFSFAQMGIPAIADPRRGQYTAGDVFQLQMQLPEGLSVSSSEWFFDGEEKTGAKSVSLTAGAHTVTAVLHYADGSTETFDLVLNVN